MEDLYCTPGVDVAVIDGDVEEDEVVWWLVVLGASYALTLAYAAYCTARHGHPDIGFGWGGFRVRCNS